MTTVALRGQASAQIAFASEALLVEEFLHRALPQLSPWGALRTGVEFDYGTGRADVVALTHDDALIAFEAKLVRWRDALHQAFRNTFFAARSYVLLPHKTATRAAMYEAEFRRRKAGLCSLSDFGLQILIEAPIVASPIQPWLTAQATAMIRQGNDQLRH